MRVIDLSTPCVVIDQAVVLNNLQKVQRYFDALNLSFRPHIKTHKIPALAKQQLALGAIGINCQKISEAEPFVEAGIRDILLTYNIIGLEKIARLHALWQKCDLKVTIDSTACVQGLSDYFAKNNGTLKVLIECDTGGGRCGVQSPQEALALAQFAQSCAGIEVYGLMTYPAPHQEQYVHDFFSQAKQLIEQAGISLNMITTGGTPSLYHGVIYTQQESTIITEYRAGTYIYGDRSLVTAGTYTLADCALTVQCTVVSVPCENRCIIDAGSKALSSDLLNQTDFGYVQQFPEARITALSEEHGTLDISACPQKPQIGDVINVIPNHCCVVSNLFDQVYFYEAKTGLIHQTHHVKARGCVF